MAASVATQSGPDEADAPRTTIRYDRQHTVPAHVVKTCIHALGFTQWNSNADYDHACELQRLCQGCYALYCIGNHQSGSGSDWNKTRQFRRHIVEKYSRLADFFDEYIDYETPDVMFDAVEIELAAYDLLADIPPERETEFVDPVLN